jgi:hypothetical protein
MSIERLKNVNKIIPFWFEGRKHFHRAHFLSLVRHRKWFGAGCLFLASVSVHAFCPVIKNIYQ